MELKIFFILKSIVKFFFFLKLGFIFVYPLFCASVNKKRCNVFLSKLLCLQRIEEGSGCNVFFSVWDIGEKE